jgi:hypothetical protein
MDMESAALQGAVFALQRREKYVKIAYSLPIGTMYSMVL